MTYSPLTEYLCQKCDQIVEVRYGQNTCPNCKTVGYMTGSFKRPATQPPYDVSEDEREPAGLDEPKSGTYLYGIKTLWREAKDGDKDFLAKLYDHVNALYVEQRIYKMNDTRAKSD